MPAYVERISKENLTLPEALIALDRLQQSSFDLADLVAAILHHTVANEENIVRAHPDEGCPVRVGCEMLVTLGAMEKLDDDNWKFTFNEEIH